MRDIGYAVVTANCKLHGGLLGGCWGMFGGCWGLFGGSWGLFGPPPTHPPPPGPFGKLYFEISKGNSPGSAQLCVFLSIRYGNIQFFMILFVLFCFKSFFLGLRTSPANPPCEMSTRQRQITRQNRLIVNIRLLNRPGY